MPMSHERNLPLPFPVRTEYPDFAIISDTHVGARNSVYPAFIRVIDELKIETIIHTGDVINKPGSRREWKRFFETTGSEKTLHVAPEPRYTVHASREVYDVFLPILLF
jgi:3',5'-cyclic AMP phosphodiesterase CpdA